MSNKRGTKKRGKAKTRITRGGSAVRIGEAFSAIRNPNEFNKPINFAELMASGPKLPWDKLHFGV